MNHDDGKVLKGLARFEEFTTQGRRLPAGHRLECAGYNFFERLLLFCWSFFPPAISFHCPLAIPSDFLDSDPRSGFAFAAHSGLRVRPLLRENESSL